MLSPRQIVARGVFWGVLAAVIGAGAFLAYVAWYATTDRIFPGVSVGATPVGGMSVRAARVRVAGGPWVGTAGVLPQGGAMADPQFSPPAREGAILRLRWEDQTWPLSLREVGVVPDMRAAMSTAHAIGRDGATWQKARVFLVGMLHGHYVPLDTHLRDDVIRERLESVAAEVRQPAVDATFDFASGQATEDAPGREVDMDATMRAIRSGIMAGQPEVDLVVRTVLPSVRTADLADARQVQVSRFTTPILAAEPGRLQNIAIAVRKINGIALRPGQVFSFNELVGPRDAEHGWAQAKELYQGEFVLGYGGGICQVSSTLYNTVLLGGLEVKERHYHDRPLQYVEPGRDATVAWKLLDFRFRNNSEAALLIGARIVPGSPQQIEVTLHAPRPVVDGSVVLETTDVRYFPPDLEEVVDQSLAPHERRVVDEGHYGIEVTVYRVFRLAGQDRREKVSTDTYKPKAGKVKVGPALPSDTATPPAPAS